MTTRKKAFFAAAAICLILCIVAVIVAVSMFTKLSYAENHYEVTRHEDTRIYTIHPRMVYGCGEIDCEYCNGQVQKNEYGFDSFVFYKTVSNLRTAAIVMAILFGGAGASFLLASFSSSRSKPTDSAPARGQTD